MKQTVILGGVHVGMLLTPAAAQEGNVGAGALTGAAKGAIIASDAGKGAAACFSARCDAIAERTTNY